MRKAVLLSLGLLSLAGCAQSSTALARGDAELALAEKARDAVLALIRSDRGLFFGNPDPDRLKALPLVRLDEHLYAFGAFEVDVEQHGYAADVAVGLEGAEVYLYNGPLRVRPDGRWEAGRPEVRRGWRVRGEKP
jgi:hypothetical protein